MQSTHEINGKAVLALSLELSAASWKSALTDLRRKQPSEHTFRAVTPGGRLQEVVQCVERLQAKWELPPDCEVWVLYEAGQDGFWIARALSARGWHVVVADPASIPVARHARRAKTDRLDAKLLLDSLLGWLRGETSRLHVVQVPSEDSEARRQLSRDRGELQKEIGQHRNRIRSLLRTEGCWDALEGDDLAARLDELRNAQGERLSPPLQQRLLREVQRLQFVQQQFKELERTLLQQLPEALQRCIAQLAQLKGVGWVDATRLVLELFWRDFHNRRQVGSCVGLVAQPYDSGASRVDQGISKQGNRRVRALLIEMAWMWLRYQPDSAIARWFAQRTAAQATNKRGKRIAIVAVARRLVIALWRYLKDGLLPQGAALKAA